MERAKQRLAVCASAIENRWSGQLIRLYPVFGSAENLPGAYLKTCLPTNFTQTAEPLKNDLRGAEQPQMRCVLLVFNYKTGQSAHFKVILFFLSGFIVRCLYIAMPFLTSTCPFLLGKDNR